jgi:hypothetical protein
MIIIHSPERAAQNLLEEIINVQDLPLYQVEAYMADSSEHDPEPDPEFTHDDIITVLRHVLASDLVFFSPSYLESPSEEEAKMNMDRLQCKIWHGDIERILNGIRHQLDHWDYIDKGAFMSKETIDRQNKEHFSSFGENKYIFIKPSDADLYRSANKNW